MTLSIGLSALLMGLIGRTSDLKVSYRAAAHASPVALPTIIAGATNEAEASATLGMLVGFPLVLLAGGVMGAAFARTGEA